MRLYVNRCLYEIFSWLGRYLNEVESLQCYLNQLHIFGWEFSESMEIWCRSSFDLYKSKPSLPVTLPATSPCCCLPVESSVGPPSASWYKLGAQGGASWDIAPGPQAGECIRDAGAVPRSECHFLCRAAESEARGGHGTPGMGLAGHHPLPPWLPSHTCQGGQPQWNWGSLPYLPPTGFPLSASSPCLLPSPSRLCREDGAESIWPGAQFSAQSFPVSTLGHYTPKLPAQDRLPWRELLAVCDVTPPVWCHTPASKLLSQLDQAHAP